MRSLAALFSTEKVCPSPPRSYTSSALLCSAGGLSRGRRLVHRHRWHFTRDNSKSASSNELLYLQFRRASWKLAHHIRSAVGQVGKHSKDLSAPTDGFLLSSSSGSSSGT